MSVYRTIGPLVKISKLTDFGSTGFCDLAWLHVTFGCSRGVMTTARPGVPYPCSPQAKTMDESSWRGK